MDNLPPAPATKDGLRFVFNRPKTYCAISAWAISGLVSWFLHEDIVSMMLYFLIAHVALQLIVFKLMKVKEGDYVGENLLRQEAVTGTELDHFNNCCFYKDVILLIIGLSLFYGFSLDGVFKINWMTGIFGHIVGIGIIQVAGLAKVPSSFIRRGSEDDNSSSGPGKESDDRSRQVNWGVYTSSKSREGDTVYQYD